MTDRILVNPLSIYFKLTRKEYDRLVDVAGVVFWELINSKGTKRNWSLAGVTYIVPNTDGALYHIESANKDLSK